MHPLLAMLLITLAGGATALQAPINARLATGVGSAVNAAFVSFAVGTVALAVIALIGQTRPDWEVTRALPWYAWIGGLFGVIFVISATWGVPRIGVAMTIILMLDHCGAFGAPRQPVNLGRVAGVALVLAGVLLVRRS